MRRIFSELELRSLAGLLALVLMLTSSTFCGLLITSSPDHPQLTINICQQLNPASAPTTVPLARPANLVETNLALKDWGPIQMAQWARPRSVSAKPDTPPPKQSAWVA